MTATRPIAIITGASRGIGAATAKRLAFDGYDICVNFRADGEAAGNVVREVEQLGRRAIAVQADVATEAGVMGLFDAVDKGLGTLTALVNNAGVLDRQCRVTELTEARINRILHTNVTGTLLCCREAVKRMSTKSGGSGGGIVNVSSAAARIGSANEWVDYAASKGAVDTLTKGLANEVGGEGIRVNAVRPGIIHTTMHADGGMPDRVDQLGPTMPMGRGGYPEEVAAAIAWLLSDQSSYTTGGFVEVSGGR
ncbi:MAG: SDR family oxidoreductase [Gammaproteobacteria bacterium]